MIKITAAVDGKDVLTGEVHCKYLPQLAYPIKEIYRISKGKRLEVTAHNTVFSSGTARDIRKVYMDLYATLHDIYLEVENESGD